MFAFQGGNYASDLGGVIGLWFGLSLLTLFEFVEFVMDILVYGTKKCMPDKITNFAPGEARDSIGDVELSQGSLQRLREKHNTDPGGSKGNKSMADKSDKGGRN